MELRKYKGSYKYKAKDNLCECMVWHNSQKKPCPNEIAYLGLCHSCLSFHLPKMGIYPHVKNKEMEKEVYLIL